MTVLSPAGGGLRGAAAAEWTKLWSVRSTWWCMLAAGVLMAAAGAQFGIYTANANTDPEENPAERPGVVGVGSLAVQAADLGQFAFVALGMLLVTAEYATGMMRTAVQWTPRRGVLLAAKTAVTAVVVFVTGTAAALVAAAAAWPLLGRWGRAGAGELTGDVLSVGVYLALISVIALGVGVMLRSSAGTLTVVFMVLTVIPALLQATDVRALEVVADCLPGTAGGNFMRGLHEAYPPAAGLGILLGWAVAVWAGALAVLNRRDA